MLLDAAAVVKAPAGNAVSGSLRGRMLLSAGLVLMVFLGIMGAVLDNAFRLSAEEAESERLLLHIYALIAASDEADASDASSLYLPEALQEPHFNNPGSGLYGLVLDADGQEIWRSLSALGLNLEAGELTRLDGVQAGQENFGQLDAGSHHEALFFLSYRIIWQSTEGEASYLFVALQDFGPYYQSVAAFRNNLWGWLIAGVILLVGLQAAIMYWGLMPLSELETDLHAIEEGEEEYLNGVYPREIAGVTRSLNLLLSDERRQREKYRNTLADLAHSLKTPLSILKNEASRPELNAVSGTLDEQVDRMNEIVSYQLERAVASSSLLYGATVELQPLATKLKEVLERAYQDKGVEITVDVAPLTFSADERDIYEVLGNLLDNACKYGRSRVFLRIVGEERKLSLVVEDDGPGIAVADRERVLERGARLDSRERGQGIGLAVVAEIADRYHGHIEITSSDLGGARIEVSLG